MTFAFFALFLNLMKTSESSRQMKKKKHNKKKNKSVLVQFVYLIKDYLLSIDIALKVS